MAFVLSHDKSIRVTGVNGGVGNNRRNRVTWPVCSAVVELIVVVEPVAVAVVEVVGVIEALVGAEPCAVQQW